MSGNVLVFTTNRQTRRQIARALGSGGLVVEFFEKRLELQQRIEAARTDLVIVDNDGLEVELVEQTLAYLNENAGKVGIASPLVLLSMVDRGALLHLVEDHDIRNLVAKHGAIRASYRILDERELLVTCEKVMRRDIFGIEKYVSNWGIQMHHTVITSMADKGPALTRFETFLHQLDCPPVVVAEIVNVADELVLNAVVHAPVGADGKPKYEDLGPVPDLVLEPGEYVNLDYGCDGQRLMLAVNDNFGRLRKTTLLSYLSRGMEAEKLEPEMKASGAGLGLVMSYRSIHQLIFNIHETVRTEVIAGWYLRINTAQEFRAVGKSFNLFWLPSELRTAVAHLSGRIDETTRFGKEGTFNLGRVSGISSRGIARWLQFVRSRGNQKLEVLAAPDPFVRAATEIEGVLHNVVVRTVLAPFECEVCEIEQAVEREVQNALSPGGVVCSACGGPLRFAGIEAQYEMFAKIASP